ncbi:MAG: hypothetical protein MIO93_13935, partial [ANME-2 cluster archaeon]|nr:hypothetical protein [ANME-2 cluster archaeon]
MKIKDSVLSIIVSSILILMLLISPVYAYQEYASDGDGGESNMGGAVTSYGTDVVIVQHFIEVDQVSNPGYLKVTEIIVFKNIGTENYTGPIFSCVPDGVFNEGMIKLRMSANISGIPLNVFFVDDNVIGWNDTILAGSVMPPRYQLQYMVPAEPAGKMTESVTFTKKLKYPTNVNYDYIPSTGMPVLVVKLVKSDDITTSIVNEDGSKIEADFIDVIEGSKTYNWMQPQFVEVSFVLNRSSIDQSDVSLYLLLLLVILLVIGIPILRGKNPSAKSSEEKTSKVGPTSEDEDIYLEQEDEEYDEEFDEDIETGEGIEESVSDVPALNEEDVKSFDIDELKSAKNALFKVLSELDEDYADGALSEEEYNSIRDK